MLRGDGMHRQINERRRAPRVRAVFPVELRSQASNAKAQLKDISSNGVCLTSDVAFKEMTEVEMALELPGRATPVELIGAVVRCEPLAAAPTFEVAIYFTRIAVEHRQSIEEFVSIQLASSQEAS